MITTNKKMNLISPAAAILIFILILVSCTEPVDGQSTNMRTFAYITNYDDGTVSVINTTTNTVAATVTVGSGPYGVAVNPSGTKVYVANEGSNTVSVIDATTNKVTATVKVGTTPEGVAISPDGSKVYVANRGSNTISVINAATNTVTATVPVGTNPVGVAVSPNGSRLYVTNYNSNSISVINTATNTVITTIITTYDYSNYPCAVAVSPDGSKVYVAAGTGTFGGELFVIDTVTNTMTFSVGVSGEMPFGATVSPDGKKAYVTSIADGDRGNGIIDVIDIATNNIIATVNVGEDPTGVSVSPDGKKVYVANHIDNAPGTVSVIDTSTNKVTTKVKVGKNPVAFGKFICSLPTTVRPAANFSSNVTSGYAPLNVAFTDKSTNNPTAWKWTFGDGTNSTSKNPIHGYYSKGNYTVSLTATNAAGNNTTTKTNYIKVSAVVKPVANFTGNVTSGYTPLSVAFSDRSTNNPTSWKWTFGDGTNSTSKNPIHKYSVKGNYTVTLTASNSAGSNIATKTNYIKVLAVVKPVANFTSNVTSGTAPLNVAFTDRSTNTPTSWKWTFGDGTNSTSKNPIHKYSTKGNYTVSLTATNAAGGNTITKTSYIKVAAVVKPVANFASNVTSGYAPLSVAFTDKSTNNPTVWKWTFGDGTNSTVKNPVHRYSTAGNYTIALTASNSAGSNTVTKTNYIKVIKR